MLLSHVLLWRKQLMYINNEFSISNDQSQLTGI